MRAGLTLSSLLILGVLSITSLSYADSIRGVVVRKNDDTVMVRLVGSKAGVMKLRPVYQSVLNQLNKLKSGDIFQGIGNLRYLDSGEQVVMLESIDFVGLRNLLGAWIASNLVVVDFVDFDQVKVLIPSAIGLKTYLLSYSLAPSHDSDWMIFLRDMDSVVLGSLRLTTHTALIEFIDPETATKPLSSIELIRVGN